MSAAALALYAQRKLVPVTVADLLQFGRRVRHGYVARTLREELCARLAHQGKRLAMLPRETGPSKQLITLHTTTFQELLAMEPIVKEIHHLSGVASATSMKSDPMASFRRCVESISSRHATNLETLMEAKKSMCLTEEEEPGAQKLIDDFLAVHIGSQLLCTHFLQASRLQPSAGSGGSGSSGSVVGAVEERCSLRDIIDDAVSETQLITEHHLEDAPDVVVEGNMEAHVCCIPSHVHHVLFETLKNAMRATAMNHREVTHMIPAVKVRICSGPTEVAVSISDQGGGMARATVDKAFRYLWTSSETYADVQKAHSEVHSYQRDSDPLSGMGIGLPVSRLYARHFGGDLRLLSLHGYGTTAALFLPTALVRERIPLRWRDSCG